MSIYNKFKPTAIAEQQARRDEVSSTIKDNDGNGNGRIPRKQIKNAGTYKVRIWPAHPAPQGIIATALEAKVVYLVPGFVPKRDSDNKLVRDSENNVIQELRIRAVFDSRVHGGAPLDLIDTYGSLLNRKAEQLYPNDIEKQKSYLLPFKGNKLQGGQYPGINPIKSFMFYGEEVLKVGGEEKREFALFEVGKAVEKGIYKVAASENDNDPLGTDACFTDPVEGRLARIIVDPEAGRKEAANWYTVSVVTEQEKVTVDGRPMTVLKNWPITEEQLEWYDKEVEPLRAFRTKFTNRDLNIALEGLRLFDAEHGYGIVETDEFIETYQSLLKYFPEPAEGESQDNGGNTVGASAPAASSTDEFSLMDRNELVDFIANNQLPIMVLPRFTDDDLRDLIRETKANMTVSSKPTTPAPEVTTPPAEVKAPAVEAEPLSQVEPTTYAETEEEEEVAEAKAPAATGALPSWKDRVKALSQK